MSIIQEMLKRASVSSALDVATGRGEFLQSLMRDLPRCEKFTAIDIKCFEEWDSERFSGKNVSFQAMDAAAMDFHDWSFDLVAMANSLHHMPSPARVLSEMVRVLRPGGVFLFREMVSDRLTPAQMTHSLIHQWWGKIDTLNGITHHNPFSWADLEGNLRTLNLEDWIFEEESDPEEDPFDPDTLRELEEVLVRYQAKTTDQELISEGERLRERVRTVGFQSATALSALGIKPMP